MTVVSAPQAAAPARRSDAAAAMAREQARDVRLDFFRGLGMFIILIAHIPWNSWTFWIPARFGFSDATEIFVFCSGAASAIAFYKVFEVKGFWIGCGRVAYRIWQIYWCHIGVFFATAAALVAADGWLADDRFHARELNLTPFLDHVGKRLPELFTLTYVPNYFDILVMYIVVLALMPIVVALGRLRPWLALAFSAALWALVSQPWLAFFDAPVFTALNLTAETWSGRDWFFNPFAWQLCFYTGFAFALGWLPRPPIDRRLMALAAVVLLVSVPVNFWAIVDANPWAREWRDANGPLWNKSYFGILRYVHFLALAYLVWALAGEAGSRLPRSGAGGRVVTVVRRVGQQSLAVFVASLLLARLLGVWIHAAGRDEAAIAAANLVGFALLVAVAYGARWFRRQPWKGVGGEG